MHKNIYIYIYIYKDVNNERNTGNISLSIMNVIQEIYVNNERNTGNINMSIMNKIQETQICQ